MLGLVAGQGTLPLAVARAARRQGRAVAAVAFHGETDPALEQGARVTWLDLGQVGAALAALRESGAREVVLAGKVAKTGLLSAPGSQLRPDAAGQRLLRGLGDHRDASVLQAVAALLESEGLCLLPQAALVPELLAGPGPLGRRVPTESERRDLIAGFRVARALTAHDVGQTVVVKDGTVLAAEAIEGTDAAIHRGGGFAAGACIVKVARPGQDPRFDLPTIGPDTLRAAARVRAAALAFEAGRSLVLEAEALARQADAHDIALVGLDPSEVVGSAG